MPVMPGAVDTTAITDSVFQIMTLLSACGHSSSGASRYPRFITLMPVILMFSRATPSSGESLFFGREIPAFRTGERPACAPASAAAPATPDADARKSLRLLIDIYSPSHENQDFRLGILAAVHHTPNHTSVYLFRKRAGSRDEAAKERLDARPCRSVLCLYSTPKPVDFTAIAFRWLAFPQRFEMRHRFALFRQLQPQLPAGLCLTVERLRNRRRAAHLTEDQDLHLKVAAVVLHLQQVAGSDLTRSLGSLPVGLNPAEFKCPCSERARLEESGGPEPLVHSHAGHNPILVPRGCATWKWRGSGFRRNSPGSARSEYARTLLQPARAQENSPGREPWE